MKFYTSHKVLLQSLSVSPKSPVRHLEIEAGKDEGNLHSPTSRSSNLPLWLHHSSNHRKSPKARPRLPAPPHPQQALSWVGISCSRTLPPPSQCVWTSWDSLLVLVTYKSTLPFLISSSVSGCFQKEHHNNGDCMLLISGDGALFLLTLPHCLFLSSIEIIKAIFLADELVQKQWL